MATPPPASSSDTAATTAAQLAKLQDQLKEAQAAIAQATTVSPSGMPVDFLTRLGAAAAQLETQPRADDSLEMLLKKQAKSLKINWPSSLDATDIYVLDYPVFWPLLLKEDVGSYHAIKARMHQLGGSAPLSAVDIANDALNALMRQVANAERYGISDFDQYYAVMPLISILARQMRFLACKLAGVSVNNTEADGVRVSGVQKILSGKAGKKSHNHSNNGNSNSNYGNSNNNYNGGNKWANKSDEKNLFALCRKFDKCTRCLEHRGPGHKCK